MIWLKGMIKKSKTLYYSYRRFRMFCIRNFFSFKNVHHDSYIVSPKHISKDIIVSAYSFISYSCQIGPNVVVGKYSMLAPCVAIVGADHNYDNPGRPIIFSGRPPLKQTVIGEDVWVGYGSIILTGVNIGSFAIVAAGSVVTRDVKPFSIVAGVPAREIGLRFNNQEERDFHKARVLSGNFKINFCKSKI